MDRNSIIGFVLIGLLLVVYTFINQPTKEELEKIQRQRDSIAKVEQLAKEQKALQKTENFAGTAIGGTVTNTNTTQNVKESFITLENELIKLTLSNYGGKIASVELKKYKTYKKAPVILWESDKASLFGLNIGQQGNILSTQNVVFQANQLNDSTVIMTAQLPTGSKAQYTYTLAKGSYEVDFDVQLDNLKSNLGTPGQISFVWSEDLLANEKGRSFEDRYTSVYYKEIEGDVKHLSPSSKEEEEAPEEKLRWVAFKSQFFSSVLISEGELEAKMATKKYDETSKYLKRTSANISLPYKGNNNVNYPLKFYFGPNEYTTLREYGKDIDLHELVDLGWGPIAWVNRFLVVEIFNFLEKYVTSNYGIIILLLTLIIKLLLSPLTYKSYVSSAKMRVLKPQIEEINERIPKDKAMERQQATMELYRKAGVNPLGGCVPMLVQMPILIAMFYFFPVAIQLRQKSFLWASDLSSYDSIASLPFNIPFYGDHVSLFCLLMAITNLVYTYINMQNQPTTSQPGMPNMKFMMYLMPIIFLGIFNQYASGLSYYYFIATLFTIIQTVIIREFMIDDKKLLARLEANKAKPQKPKSKFRQRLEEMQKEQIKQQKLRNKK